MRVTRSSTRKASQVAAEGQLATNTESQKPDSKKRKRANINPASVSKTSKKFRGEPLLPVAGGSTVLNEASQLQSAADEGIETPQALVPAVLTFSLEEGKQHLIHVDHRFEDIFQRLACRPFEHLERLDPFRTLVNSILGQQISWLAARSITHRFIRLFDPSLPEKPIEHQEYAFFPTAHQVSTKSVETLRTAGLSMRKAEYVLDLASRFADGRLSTDKLLHADDEQLANMLIEVRGIGRWTVDMFALFSLRRPDILPIGDLGVQRGLLRWFLSLHSPSHPLTISPKKLPRNPSDEENDEVASSKRDSKNKYESDNVLPSLGEAESLREQTPDLSSVPPAPMPDFPATPKKVAAAKTKGKKKVSKADPEEETLSVLPPLFTPSVNQTLNMSAVGDPDILPTVPVPLPDGLTPAILKSRLEGKKIKGAFLTPKEMEELTECWRPYRSLGVYYMWALAEGPK